MRWLKAAAGLFGALVLAAPAVAQTPARLIRLNDAADLVLAQRLNRSVDTASSAVTACVDGGRTLAQCHCLHKEALANVRVILREAASAKPDWGGDDAVLYWEENGRSINLSIAGIRQSLAQAATNCPGP